MIQINDVTKLYPSQGAGAENADSKGDQAGAIHALNHISLHVAQGEWLSIMGPSGSGKNWIHLPAVSSDSVSYRGGERYAGAVLSQHDG